MLFINYSPINIKYPLYLNTTYGYIQLKCREFNARSTKKSGTSFLFFHALNFVTLTLKCFDKHFAGCAILNPQISRIPWCNVIVWKHNTAYLIGTYADELDAKNILALYYILVMHVKELEKQNNCLENIYEKFKIVFYQHF